MAIVRTRVIPSDDTSYIPSLEELLREGDSDVEESDEQTLANQAEQVMDTTITAVTTTATTATATVNTNNSQGHKLSQKRSGPGGVDKSSESLTHKRNASKVTKSSTQKKSKVTLHSRLTAHQKGVYNKQLGKINQKLREKTLEELLKMHDESTEELFCDITKDAYHEKRMAMLKEWEEQIGD